MSITAAPKKEPSRGLRKLRGPRPQRFGRHKGVWGASRRALPGTGNSAIDSRFCTIGLKIAAWAAEESREVELLIVVIILSILAVVVIPQFANTTDDARLSAAPPSISTTRSTASTRAATGMAPTRRTATWLSCGCPASI